jgi:HEAT repeat protein
LRCLFGREANFLFSYRASDSSSGAAASPSEVWVLGKGSGKVAQTAQVKDKPAPAEAGEALSALLGEAGKEFARNPQAARDAALHAANGDIRRLAIAYLTQQGKPEDLHILTEIVRDKDPQVRQSAVEALGPWLIDDPQVRQAFTRLMETSGDPEVRQLAADALGIGGPLQTSVNADQ